MRRHSWRCIATLAMAVWVVGSARAQTATYIGSNTTNADRWNLTTSWDTAAVPSGTDNVIIPADKIACAWSASTPSYSGNLSIGANAMVQIGYTTVYAASWNALGTPGSTTITMADGSTIKARTSGTVTMPAITLTGNATIVLGESTQIPPSVNFNYAVSGSHQLTLSGNMQLSGAMASLNAGNGFSSLIINTLGTRGNPPRDVTANATGSLGIGNVTVNGLATSQNRSHRLVFNDTVNANAMADGATLHLNGTGLDGTGTKRIQLLANETIGSLNLEGFPFPAGTYGRVGTPATVDYEWNWIDGDGVLTVNSAPADSSAPELTFSNNSGGGTHYYDLLPTLTYTLTFDEAVTSSVSVADCENAGSAPVTITSVTQTTLNTFRVVVTPSGPGTMILRIKASATFHDVYGNSLAGPITDVTAVPLSTEPSWVTIYEPFVDADAALTGNSPGYGLAGTWSATATVQAGTLTYGSFPVTANEAVLKNQYGGVAVNVARLNEKGLLADGASLWFSVLLKTGGDISINGDLGFAFGTERIGSGNNIPLNGTGDQDALGFTFKENLLRASHWDQNAGTETLIRSSTNSGNAASPNTLYLVAGRFVWGAASDEIEVYMVDTDLNMGSRVSWYTTSSNIDQSQFDTLSIGSKDATPSHLIREIRFGATFDEVMGIPPPSTATVVILK